MHATQSVRAAQSLRAVQRDWPIDLTNLAILTEEARAAALEGDNGPPDPIRFTELWARLEPCRSRLPPLYRSSVFDPYVRTLEGLGEAGFNRLLLDDPDREGLGRLLLDLAHTLLQNGEGYAPLPTDAFQEATNDLYDGFVSEEDRHGVKPPDHGVIAPLVKWGQAAFGPYTWPCSATEAFGVGSALVSLPPANARRAVVAWAALAHETAGHDILAADDGLQAELAERVRTHVAQEEPGFLGAYWADRIEETASDVMGIMNMGPAAGIGLIAYFRGLNAAWSGEAKLRNTGPASDPHPADIMRGLLAAEVVGLLSFGQAPAWADVLRRETEKDVTEVRLAGKVVSTENARRSAALVARTLVTERMDALEHHALGDIQDWRDEDERAVARLRTYLTTTRPLPRSYGAGFYAAHAVAAGVMASLAAGAQADAIFQRMLAVLKNMHDMNPCWGPLYVVHPGNLRARRSFMPEQAEVAE